MTHHRLARCDLDEVLGTVRRRYPHSSVADPVDDPDTAKIPVFPRARSTRRSRSLVWRHRMVPGRVRLQCWLDVDQGANGVLVHLRVSPQSGQPLAATRMGRLAIDVWCSRELASLVQDAEASYAETNRRGCRHP